MAHRLNDSGVNCRTIQFVSQQGAKLHGFIPHGRQITPDNHDSNN